MTEQLQQLAAPEPTPSPDQGDVERMLATLHQVKKVLLVVDVVDSVRLMAAQEQAVVARWHAFAQHARAQLPQWGGHMVKSLGDGLMVEFDHADLAVQAALALHQSLRQGNATLAPPEQMWIRAGIHSATVYQGQDDIYGHGVNLAARVAGLGGPGETMVTATIRDELIDGVALHIEDMGECNLKNLSAPVRVYRVGAVGPQPLLVALQEQSQAMVPTIAVIPFASYGGDNTTWAIGDLLAEGIIAQLGRSASMRVISRLSSVALQAPGHGAHQLAKQHLGADYAVSGSFACQGDKLLVSAEIARTADGTVVWVDRMACEVADLLQVDSQTCQHIAQAAYEAVLQSAAQQALTAPMPLVSSHALLMASIQWMHRAAHDEFAHSKRALDALVERHPRAAASHAWTAKWHVLAATRQFAEDTQSSATQALNHTRRALDAEPSNSMALAMDGFAHLHLKGDLPYALQMLGSATHANPNEPMAWLFQSVAYAFAEQGEQAWQCSQRAMALSPLDPLRYYYESLAATAALSAQRWEDAIALDRQSLQRNQYHLSSWRTLVAAQIHAGDAAGARQSAQALMQRFPRFTVSSYEQSGAANFPLGKQVAHALAEAGVSR